MNQCGLGGSTRTRSSSENPAWILLASLSASAFASRGAHCEGEGDDVGVVAPLGGVAQVIFHGVQVVEVGAQLRVRQDRGVEEDGEEQVEVEREEGEVKENHTCMKIGWNEGSRTS